MLQNRRVQVRFARANPVHVALKGINLAVMDDVAVGVRTLPARRRVSGVARVHERHSGLYGSVVEVGKEAAHLRGYQHALVHNGARAHGAHVENLARKRVLSIAALLNRAAAHIQTTLKVVASLHVFWATQECLQNGRHAGASRLAQVVRINRHAAPEKKRHASLGTALFKHTASIGYAKLILREEEHGHTIVALGRQNLAALLCLFTEEVMRNLEQDTCTVARVLLQARTTTVFKIHQNRKRIVQNLVTLLTVQICERANAARVVFKLRTIQPSRRGVCTCLRRVCGHGLLLHRVPPR